MCEAQNFHYNDNILFTGLSYTFRDRSLVHRLLVNMFPSTGYCPSTSRGDHLPGILGESLHGFFFKQP